MRTLIIPDVHDKIGVAQSIIDGTTHDRRIFLGDFFDDFPTGLREATATARWLRGWLRDPGSDVLWGNHDISYGFGNDNGQLLCSGFTKNKWRAIHSELSHEDWHSFKLHLTLPGPRRPFLFTHAGFDIHFVADGQDGFDVATGRCERALSTLSDPDPSLRGRDTMFGAGISRSGRQYRGGVTWLDWFEFRPPAGMDQIVGHTPGREPKVEEHHDAVIVCLDTGLKHYGLLDDGHLSVMETSKLPRSLGPPRDIMV